MKPRPKYIIENFTVFWDNKCESSGTQYHLRCLDGSITALSNSYFVESAEHSGLHVSLQKTKVLYWLSPQTLSKTAYSSVRSPPVVSPKRLQQTEVRLSLINIRLRSQSMRETRECDINEMKFLTALTLSLFITI
ncbi:hypothetical protein WUBG_11107 [Wuchereria bancrofti]|uniref:Uncharacterized protein n=1 Tax=Wuchereria bancrofti TaxID=6293 RepID=J9E771_WUCBA|nr:hypothetical protein WUBG_11107 [Wuchereria bancrofti]